MVTVQVWHVSLKQFRTLFKKHYFNLDTHLNNFPEFRSKFKQLIKNYLG